MVFGTLSDLWNAVYNSWSIFKGIGFRHLVQILVVIVQ